MLAEQTLKGRQKAIRASAAQSTNNGSVVSSLRDASPPRANDTPLATPQRRNRQSSEAFRERHAHITTPQRWPRPLALPNSTNANRNHHRRRQDQTSGQ